jgi:hypothetical protein
LKSAMPRFCQLGSAGEAAPFACHPERPAQVTLDHSQPGCSLSFGRVEGGGIGNSEPSARSKRGDPIASVADQARRCTDPRLSLTIGAVPNKLRSGRPGLIIGVGLAIIASAAVGAIFDGLWGSGDESYLHRVVDNVPAAVLVVFVILVQIMWKRRQTERRDRAAQV